MGQAQEIQLARQASGAGSIVADILDDVAIRESQVSFSEIKARSRDTPAPRDATAALLGPGCSVIAEIKRAVPYRDVGIQIDLIAEMAHDFEEVGVHLLACQTERLRFSGSLEDMWEARSAAQLPMMIRDVIVDPYQIHEARCFGADIVPLHVGLLEQARFVSLVDRIESLGMTSAAEVRTPEEADRALAAGVKVIGVNAWDISAALLNPENFISIVPSLPTSVVRIALGGVAHPQDLLSYAGHGADAVLVGESIMSASDPRTMARRMVAMGQHPACPSR